MMVENSHTAFKDCSQTSPLLARLRHADERAECLLIGVDRKWLTCAQNVEIDPNQTFARTAALRTPKAQLSTQVTGRCLFQLKPFCRSSSSSAVLKSPTR
jgi:hypothetical protein